MVDVLTNLIILFILQYMHLSNHHIIHFNLYNLICQLYLNKATGEFQAEWPF